MAADNDRNDLVRAFVEEVESRRTADMSFRDDPKLPALPTCGVGGGKSRYLLLAAAIDAATASTGIRPLLADLDRRMCGLGHARGLLDLSLDHKQIVLDVITTRQRGGELGGWQIKAQVPRILAEANAFVDYDANGDFDAWARQFDSPHPIVDKLAAGIWYQGRPRSEARKKMWMLMRWLVRPAPDLRLWDHLDPADLMVPVDAHVARFAARLGVIDGHRAKEPFWREVEAITAYARTLFPNDPAKIDYAFFMWSRSHSARALDPDMCATLFEPAGARCPLATSIPCGERCR